ncbi:MAG TPA: peroxiredoxin family protein, partial [Gemmataceae bacterium]
MVQLQKHQEQLRKAGVQVVGISYDPVEVLAEFAKKANVTYPLLSDPGSETIRAYGVLNEQAKGRAEGVPHPATFLIDKKGVVRAKLAHPGY